MKTTFFVKLSFSWGTCCQAYVAKDKAAFEKYLRLLEPIVATEVPKRCIDKLYPDAKWQHTMQLHWPSKRCPSVNSSFPINSRYTVWTWT